MERRAILDEERGLYKIRTIARLTGFSPTLLRAWERRYGLMEPSRGRSTHRLYTEDDLTVLYRARDLLAQGRSIGEVAALGRGTLLAEVRERDPEPPGPETLEEVKQSAGEMVQAALELDETRLTELLDRACSSAPWNLVVETVIVPAARQIGELWASHQASVATEHLFTTVVRRRLSRMLDSEAPPPTLARTAEGGRPPSCTPLDTGATTRTAICACLPEEQHELGCLLVALRLQRLHFRVTLLGTSLPLADLEDTVARKRPHSVFLSVTRASVLDAHRSQLLEMLRRLEGQTLFVLGGEGIRAYDLAQLLAAGLRLWPPGRPLSELDLLFFERPS